MKNLVVIFGGKSTEHDISIISALQAIANLDEKKYKIFAVYVDKQGQWWTGEKLKNIDFFKDFNAKKLKRVCVVPGSKYLFKVGLHSTKIITKIDCILNVFHGKNGEDGTMQGLFELCNIPYTSCGVTASAVGIDKIVQKGIYKSINCEIVEHFWMDKNSYLSDKSKYLNNNEFDFPKIVKPSCLGSSIGISVVNNSEELEKAIDLAFMFDDRVLVEKALTDFKEINIALLKQKGEIIFSDIEQPKNWKQFLDFEEKYLAPISKTGTSKIGMGKINGNSKQIKISKTQLNIIKDISKKIYQMLNLKGVVRFDFMIDKQQNKVFINEINTIPGSLAFYLWQKQGISYCKLLDILIDEAIESCNQNLTYTTNFESSVLDGFSGKKQKF